MSSFISTQFLVLNLDDLFDALSKKFAISDIPLLYCYTVLLEMYIFFNVNINSSIIYKNIHLFLVLTLILQ